MPLIAISNNINDRTHLQHAVSANWAGFVTTPQQMIHPKWLEIVPTDVLLVLSITCKCVAPSAIP